MGMRRWWIAWGKGGEKKGGGGGGARPLSVVEKEFFKYFPRIKSFTTYDL